MKVDYLTFSLPYEGNVWGVLPQVEPLQGSRENEVKPNGRYYKAWRLNCGAMFSIPKDGDWKQRALIEMQGKHCERFREYGFSDDDLLYHMIMSHGKPSRMDCAFDTNDESASVEQIWEAWEKNQIKTKILTAYKNTTKGRKKEPENSVYFGAPDSEQRIVVYDKAKQMKLLEQAWIRVELRVYGDTAKRLAKDALVHTIDTVSRKKVRNMLRTKVGWFEKMVAGDDVDLTPRVDEPNIMAWLSKQVTPAIERVPDTNPELIEDVIHWLQGRLNVLKLAQMEMGE